VTATVSNKLLFVSLTQRSYFV